MHCRKISGGPRFAAGNIAEEVLKDARQQERLPGVNLKQRQQQMRAHIHQHGFRSGVRVRHQETGKEYVIAAITENSQLRLRAPEGRALVTGTFAPDVFVLVAN